MYKCIRRYAMGWGYPPYVPVAQRRANAQREAQRMSAKGKRVSPVQVTGRAIASTFWGKAWCDNLESYSDFSNRLPRGRTYVRNGSVIDLQIEPGKVTSLVSGSSLYRIVIQIKPLDEPRWTKLKQQCAAGIGSLVELLQGRLSQGVMAIVTSRANGLFPEPAEIEMSCSCPDWAEVCKHVAATLYGVGSRLDHSPELLFRLRKVDHLDLIAQAGRPAAASRAAGRKTIAGGQLADVFGIELDTNDALTAAATRRASKGARKQTPATTEKTMKNRAGTPKKNDKAPPDSGPTSNSKRKVLTASERKRIAQAQKKRWAEVREKLLLKNDHETPSSPEPAGKTAKTRPAQTAPRQADSLNSRTPRRSRR